MFDSSSLKLLEEALGHLEGGFDLPQFQPQADQQAMRTVLLEVAERMRDNFPYPHPLYAGQMLKPPHAMARLAYSLALFINPNNHALDGGRASSQMEKEAVAQIAAMVGWNQHLGHLTSGGTFANLEALWVSGRLAPGRKVVTSSQAHYTHQRICGVLGIPFQAIDCDRQGRLDVEQFKSLLDQGEVGTLVVTLGTTGLGSLDPLDEILELRDRYNFRVHVDSAYGGYFGLADNLSPRGQRLYALLDQVDSLVIDPHKHGLQPYGCGCVLFRDPAVGRFYKHDSPYTYFSSEEMHLGEISLECSRPGASAVALWATQRLLPLTREGQFARWLGHSRDAALELHRRLTEDPGWWAPWEPELDIVVWAPRGPSASAINQLTRRIYREAEKRHLHLALIQVNRALVGESDLEWDEDHLLCLRSCLMKADHSQWLDSIWGILQESRATSVSTD